jgi:hypothetical protein
MKTILTVVFVTSIFTLFVQSATAMPPNQWHSEVYDKNLRSWMLVIQRKVTEQSKFKDFKRLVGERTIQVTCRLTTESDLGDIQLVTSSRSDEAEQVVLLLLRKVSSVPKPPSGIPLQ